MPCGSMREPTNQHSTHQLSWLTSRATGLAEATLQSPTGTASASRRMPCLDSRLEGGLESGR